MKLILDDYELSNVLDLSPSRYAVSMDFTLHSGKLKLKVNSVLWKDRIIKQLSY